MVNNKLVEDKLKKYGQEHILEKLNKMDLKDQENIINKILEIDFEEMNELYKSTLKKIDPKETEITPIGFIDKEKIPEEERKKICEIGENIIKQDEYAVVTMAGGQGTRLRLQ